MNKVYNWITIIQNAVFRPTCILCGNPGFNMLDLCESCHRHLPKNLHCCYRCAEIFPAPAAVPTLCGRCISETPAFDETYAPFIHQDDIRYLITGLKFGAQFKNARLLGGLLAEFVQQSAETPDLILPVPLHIARYRERGFNQSLEIARTVSKLMAIPLDYASCIRHKDTAHQTGLNAKSRQKNLNRAFSCIKPINVHHVAILDDVMTTGSTANALAGVLKKAGVNRVDVWVCARA